MATNNLGTSLDSSGNVAVDFVWGNFAPQPNDERTDGTPTVKLAANAAGNKSWSGYTVYPSGRLDFAADSHAIQEAGWSGYPSFTAGTGKFNITQVSGDGTTVRYEAYNTLNSGDVVDITGCSGFNLTSATVAVATRDYFTVTNSTTGSLININNGIVQLSNALSTADGAFVGGVAYVKVPNVLGLTTALAQDALLDAELTITTASAATNTALTVTAIARTLGSANLVFTATGAGAALPVGTKVVVSGFSNTDAFLNGTYTVTANATNTFTVSTPSDTSAVSLSGKSGAVAGVSGTIKSQSIAAGAASVAPAAAITITPFA